MSWLDSFKAVEINYSGISCFPTIIYPVCKPKMINCPRCGGDCTIDDNDCKYCGKQLKDTKVERRPSSPCSG